MFEITITLAVSFILFNNMPFPLNKQKVSLPYLFNDHPIPIWVNHNFKPSSLCVHWLSVLLIKIQSNPLFVRRFVWKLLRRPKCHCMCAVSDWIWFCCPTNTNTKNDDDESELIETRNLNVQRFAHAKLNTTTMTRPDQRPDHCPKLNKINMRL